MCALLFIVLWTVTMNTCTQTQRSAELTRDLLREEKDNKHKQYFPYILGLNQPHVTLHPLKFLSLPLLLLQTGYDPLQLASFLPLHGL